MRREFGTISEVRRGELYRVFWQEGGKKRSKTVRGTRADASRALAEVQVGLDGAGRMTTYSDYWETAVKPTFGRLAPVTAAQYEMTWERLLEPKIGSKKVSATTYRSVQSVISSIEAPSAQLKAKRLWSKICNMAMRRDGLLQVNPVQDVDTDPVPKRKKAVYSAEEIHSALRSVRGCKVEPLVLLSLGFGMRPEECFAMDWEDLSFEDGRCYARIGRTVLLVRNRMVEQDRTKTAGSRREAAASGYFADRLRELAEGKSGAVCPSPRGGRTSPATIAHNWKAWCAVLVDPVTGKPKGNAKGDGYVPRLKHVTFENMRTNYKTICAQAMVPPELVRVQIGHVGATVAETNYMVGNRRLTGIVADMYWEFLEKNVQLSTKKIGIMPDRGRRG